MHPRAGGYNSDEALLPTQVVERALRTGAAVLEAAEADSAGALFTGDALDDAQASVNRSLKFPVLS